MRMIEYQENADVIDRDDEIETINKRFLNSPISQVCIIQANTGIGKTSLTRKLMEKYPIDGYDYFRIRTAPHNKNDNSAEWLFIDEIFNVIQSYYDQFSYRIFLQFRYYLSNNHNKLVRSLADSEFISDISIDGSEMGVKALSSLAGSIFKSSLRMLSNLGAYNPYPIIYDNSSLSRSVKTEYIRYVLSNAKCILIIENMQNIDYISLKYLLDWINDTKNNKHGFIFEYTTSDDDSFSYLEELIHCLTATKVCVYKIELNKIEEKYILQVIDVNIPNKPTNITFNVDALKHFENYSNGNIWDLLDYARTYEQSLEEQRENIRPTMEKFIKLSAESKMVAYIILYYFGKIEKSKLYDIYQNIFYENTKTDLDNILCELKKETIIENSQSHYIIFSHASITDVVLESIESFPSIYWAVYESLITIFLKCYKGELSFETKENAWHILLRLYIYNEPDKIADLLDDFIKNIMNTISSRNAWLYIKAFIISTEHKMLELIDLYYKILELCYKTLLYKEGLWCISKMEEQLDIYSDDRLLLHKMLYLSILDKQDEVIYIYDRVIETTEKYSKKWINLKLIILNCYIEINRKDLCLDIHKELSKVPNFETYAEYPYFLRLTNIYLPYKKALHNAKKSIFLFSKMGDIEQEGKSWITYSKLLSSVGKHKRAIKAIIKDQNKLRDSHIGYACIYNNLAGYLLLSGEHGADVWNYLDIAEQYCVTVYDKISVIINKLAWCYENKAFDRIDLLENKAIEYIQQEPSKLIHCTTYYNLYLIMKENHKKKKAKKYYKKFYHLKEFCPYIQARLYGINFKNRYLKHRISKPYHICYLSFWVYDLKWN